MREIPVVQRLGGITGMIHAVFKTVSAMRILIADDDDPCRDMLCECVERALGFRPDAARDGASAWWKLSDPEVHIDLVVADINMPGVGGLDLLDRIRRSPRYAHLPVIMCSARSDRDTIIRVRQLAAHDYLLKPVRPDQLVERIRHHLAGRQFALHVA